MSQEMDEAKRQVALANRMLAELGFATGVLTSLGHASMRLPTDPNLFLVKGRGYTIDALALVRPEDMILVDLEGNMVDGPLGTSQCYEVKLHSSIYKARPDVQSVVHVHPRFTVVMSVLEETLTPMCNEGAALVREPLPVFAHSRLILSDADGIEVATQLGDRNAIILRGHGAATVGKTLPEAVVTMMQLEEQAKMNWYARCAAGPNHPHISGQEIEEHATAFSAMGQLPHLSGPLSRSTPSKVPGQAGGIWGYYADLIGRGL